MMVCSPVLLGIVILSVFSGLSRADRAMPKLADRKLCADEECSHPISMAVALQDYVAPDCRFLTIYRGQVVYVFSKLKGRGRLFWGGSVSLWGVIMGKVWGWAECKTCFPSDGKIWGEGKTGFEGGRTFCHLLHFAVFRHTRRGHQIPLQMLVSHHVVAGI
uniref:MIA SH3 domain containing n=1 Tax=Rattus norvegicus TaxID=10116 RepID=A0ABK0LEQ8_RAT